MKKAMKGSQEAGGKGSGLKKMEAPKQAAPPWREPKEPKGKGKHRKTAAGKEICYAYSRNGTCALPCRNGRAHVCEWCLQQHRNDECRSR